MYRDQHFYTTPLLIKLYDDTYMCQAIGILILLLYIYDVAICFSEIVV